MRSFIKSHRKNESLTSQESLSDYGYPFDSNTPIQSPVINQSSQLTPPQTYSSSISSPKKLLTPIKNLFSNSHGKPGTSSTNKFGHKRENHSISNISDLTNDAGKTPLVKLNTSIASKNALAPPPVFMSKQPRSSSSPIIPIQLPKQVSLNSSIKKQVSFKESSKDEKQVSFKGKPDISQPPSNPPPPPPQQSLEAQPSNLQEQPQADDTQNSTESDYEYYESDSDDSQFSFIKDRRGGRNTSVKYYKTKKSKNDFNEHDLGYEIDEFSNYDYENNGLDDFDDFEDQNFEKNIFDDDNSFENVNNINDDVSSGKDDSIFNNDNSFENVNNLNDDVSSGKDDFVFNNNDDDYDNGLNDYDDNGLDYDEQDEYDQLNEISDYDNAYDDLNENAYDDLNENAYDDLNENAYDDLNANNEYKQDTFEDEIIDDDYNEEQEETLIQPKFELDPDVKEQLKNYQPYHHSYHLSIQDLNPVKEEPQSSSNSEVNEVDILENYLEFSNSPSLSQSNFETPDLNNDQNNNLQLYDLNSPIISGLTFGSTMRYTPKSNQNPRDDVLNINDKEIMSKRILKSFHSSLDENLNTEIPNKISNMENFDFKLNEPSNDIGLGISSSNEKSVESSITNSTISSDTTFDKVTARSSINEMMDLLGSLELNNEIDENFDNPKDNNKERNKTKRSSVIGMMDFLSNMESNIEKNDHDEKKVKQNRKSIIDMMNSLSLLENSNVDSNTKRKSITNMMNTLSKIDQDNELNCLNDKPKKKTLLTKLNENNKNNSKRYSWFSNDEKLTFKTLDSNSVKSSSSDNEEPENYHFDQDLLDEVNQMPEDFDFEEHENLQHEREQQQNLGGFYRSKSYKNKPMKAVIDMNNFSTNKIETLNKTVTFYRSNSTKSNNELNSSRSISRAPSGRSLLSFGSLNEEDSEDEDDDTKTLPSFKSTPSSSMNGDINLRNLGTITETDSPRLK